MRTISELNELIENISYLKRKLADDSGKTKSLIRNGSVFVASGRGVTEFFAPSRFIGYAGNTLKKHEKNKAKHGTETTNAISKLFGVQKIKEGEVWEQLEKGYLGFCRSHDIVPSKKRRSFFVLAESSIYSEPAEVDSRSFVEGAKKSIVVNAYERNPAARKACLRHYGFSCSVCGALLVERYGEIAKDFIHVHHLKPLSEVSDEYSVDPIADLRPVCPNCHAMLHRENPPLSIESLKSKLIS